MCSLSEVQSQQKRVKALLRSIDDDKTGASSGQRAVAVDYLNRVNALQGRFPRPARMMLRMSLGSADVSMAHKDRFRYKAEYESFKLRLTCALLFLAVLAYYFIDYTLVYCTRRPF